MESANSRFLTLISENDNYTPARQDRHYTNGLFLSYGLAKGQQAPWLNWLGNLTPLADRVIALQEKLVHAAGEQSTG